MNATRPMIGCILPTKTWPRHWRMRKTGDVFDKAKHDTALTDEENWRSFYQWKRDMSLTNEETWRCMLQSKTWHGIDKRRNLEMHVLAVKTVFRCHVLPVKTWHVIGQWELAMHNLCWISLLIFFMMASLTQQEDKNGILRVFKANE